MRKGFVRAALLGFSLAASLTALGAGSGKASAGLDKLLHMEGIDSSYVITYQDVHGTPITRAAFITAVADQHHTFSLDHDPDRHTARLRLNPAGGKASRSVAKAAASAGAGPRDVMLKPGQPIPSLHLTDLRGHVVDNATLRGHVTLVNFYFATCAPCIQEVPVLVAYAKAHPEMHVLAVTFDDASTSRAYVAKHHFTWPILSDGQKFVDAMGITTYPAMALVGPDGRLLRVALSSDVAGGGDLTTASLASWVDQGTAHVTSPMR